MSGMVRFKGYYFAWTCILLLIEILIALFAHDKIIRPYIGDFLVVILVYCFIRSFIHASVVTVALFTLIFSYIVETLQYVHIADRLGLQNSKFAKTIIGTSFEWVDLIAYTLGILLVLCIEKTMFAKTSKYQP